MRDYENICKAVDAKIESNLLTAANEVNYWFSKRHSAGHLGVDHRRLMVEAAIRRYRTWIEIERCCYHMRIVDKIELDLFDA